MEYSYSEKDICDMKIEIVKFLVQGSAQLTALSIDKSRSK